MASDPLDLPAISEALARLEKKHNSNHVKIQAQLSKLLSDLTTARNAVASAKDDPAATTKLLAELSKRVSDAAYEPNVATLQKELTVAAGRLGKAVDKSKGFFLADIAAAYRSKAEMDPKIIIGEIIKHCYRQGWTTVGDEIVSESGLQGKDLETAMQQRKRYSTMHTIADALRARNVEPAMAWARERLEEEQRKLQGSGEADATMQTDEEMEEEEDEDVRVEAGQAGDSIRGNNSGGASDGGRNDQDRSREGQGGQQSHEEAGESVSSEVREVQDGGERRE